MSITNWIASQSSQYKLLLGLLGGAIIYGLFRYFIYLANKGYKKASEGKPKANWKENLKNLSESH